MKHLKKLFIGLFSLSFLAGCSENNNQDPIKHTVNFYDNNQLYLTQSVVDGECASEPEKPTKFGYSFQYWCSDEALTTPYDFSNPVKSNLSLYSSYQKLAPFYDYNEKYAPTNAPFICEQTFTENDQDIEIVLTPDNVSLNDSIGVDQVKLSGAFEDLLVSSVSISNKTVTISTTGTVKKDIGYVTFSKFASPDHVYLTAPINVNDALVPSVQVDKSSFLIDAINKDVYFSVKMENDSLKHQNSETSEQYLDKVIDGTYNYFSITEGRGVELNILAIHEDFKGFDAKIHTDGDFDYALMDTISNYVRLSISSEALVSEKNYELGFELNILQTASQIIVTEIGNNTYVGNYSIHLVGCRVSQDLRNNIKTLLTSPNNQNLFISASNATVRLETIEIKNDFEIAGKLEILTESLPSDATVSLRDIQNSESAIHPVSKLFDEIETTPRIENVKIDVGFDHEANGTVYQDEGTSYGGVKNIIQDLALHEDDEATAIDSIIFMGTTIGKISYGIGSGDYMMAADAVGKVFGMDAIRNPALLMLERIDQIMNELQEIERRIDALGQKIDDIKADLQEIGQLAYLDNFLNAYSLWNDFIRDYYTPMINQIENFSTSYYRYYYDLVMASSALNTDTTAEIKLYYDSNEKLVYPADNLTYSVDGKIIDKSKTKSIVFPELHHSLAGIRHNSGHSYRSIENDIIVDLVSYKNYTNIELEEIVKMLIFNAMKNYFSTQEKIDSFTNSFKNFCNALTASDAISSLSITPLNCFTIMLETIYNFGFEIEPDLNLVATKLSTSFYGAKKLADFVKAINSGEINISKYDDLVQDVCDELSSRRFYHSNDEHGNVYCFATNCYVQYGCDAYGILCSHGGDSHIARSSNGDTITSAPELENFSSITESSYNQIRIKLRIYNKIKGTNYSLKDYFVHIGMISPSKADLLKGIIVSINGIVRDEDVALLSYQKEKLDYYNGTDYYENYTGYEHYVNQDSFAISGKAISFDGTTSYTGLSAFIYSFYTTSIGYSFNGVLINENGFQGSYDYYFCLAPVSE